MMYIRLDSVEKVKDFVSRIERCNVEVDLISGRREVDAKSMLGIFSLDLTRPIEVRVLKEAHPSELDALLVRFTA